MQKVLYVFGGEKASGAEIVIERLICHNLQQVDAHLFIAPGNFADKLLQQGTYPVLVSPYLRKLNRANTSAVKFLYSALKNYLCLSYKVLKYIRKHNISIVHANTVVPASYLIPALIFSRIFFRNIFWLWSDHDLTYFSKKDNFFAILNLRLYTLTLVVSKAVKRKYKESRFYKKVSVLYNGLDLDIFKPDISSRNQFRTANAFRDDQIIFGIAANLSPRKGQLDLLNIVIERSKKYKNIFLVMAGNIAEEDAEYAKEVLRIASQNTAFGKYIGPVSDMIAFYNGCDIIFSNSNITGSEPLGTTIYEAMACEKIVIAANTGGTKEIITNFEDGLLFTAEDNKELGEMIDYSFDYHANLEFIKSKARKKVIRSFNIKEMSKEYNCMLETLLLL